MIAAGVILVLLGFMYADWVATIRDLERIKFEIDLLTRRPLPRTPPGECEQEGPYR